MVANPEAFLVFITTQSDTVPQGAFRDELRKARAIRDGRQPGTMLPILYEFPENILHAARPGSDAPWYDNSLWWMVTPNRGRSVHIPRLIDEFEIAKATGVHELARWASQHLNIEIGIGLRTDRWTGVEYWPKPADESLTYEEVLERSEVVVVGIDGGGLDDLFGLAVLGRETDTQRWLLWSHAWCRIGVLEGARRSRHVSRDFAAMGELTIVDDSLDSRIASSRLLAISRNAGSSARSVSIRPASAGWSMPLAEIASRRRTDFYSASPRAIA